MPHDPSEAAVEAALDVYWGSRSQWKGGKDEKYLFYLMRCALIAAAAAETALPVSEYVRRAARAAYALDTPATPPAETAPPSESIEDIGGVSARDLLFALRVCGVEEGKAAGLIRSAIDNGGLVLGARLRLYPPAPELPATVEAPDA